MSRGLGDVYKRQILMYAGRIGPISLMILFTKRSHDKNTKEFKYPDEDVLVG